MVRMFEAQRIARETGMDEGQATRFIRDREFLRRRYYAERRARVNSLLNATRARGNFENTE